MKNIETVLFTSVVCNQWLSPLKFVTRVQKYWMQLHVINLCSDLRQVGGFSPITAVSSTNKTDRHDISECWKWR